MFKVLCTMYYVKYPVLKYSVPKPIQLCCFWLNVQHCFPASSVIGPTRWQGRVFVSVTGVTGFRAGAGRRCQGSGPSVHTTNLTVHSLSVSQLPWRSWPQRAHNQPRAQREKHKNAFNAQIWLYNRRREAWPQIRTLCALVYLLSLLPHAPHLWKQLFGH